MNKVKKTINEAGFEVGDLKLVLVPVLTIDEYSSKVGSNIDILVLNLNVHDRHAAIDLVDWLEKGYDFVLDGDVSANETEVGAYTVFIELLRRDRAADQIVKIASDLEAATKAKKEKWRFRYVTDGKFHQLSENNLRKYVPLSPAAYRREVLEPIQNLQHQAGIDTDTPITHMDKELENLKKRAGIA